jgi:RNA polymerase sigma-70 factor (ECF subfamily)
VPEEPTAQRFRREIAPHLPAAYNLARWLTGSQPDAEDALQEASLRAYRFADRVENGKGRAWLFRIVRNCCYTSLRRRSNFRELDTALEIADPGANAEEKLAVEAGAEELRAALEKLAPEFREALVLREWEELSYEEIAHVTGVPEGTVMSRLSRARKHLRENLKERSSHHA